MKGLIRKIEEYEEKLKQYRLEKEELDKKHGKHKSLVKKAVLEGAALSFIVLMFIAQAPIAAGVYLLMSNDNMDSSLTSIRPKDQYLDRLWESLERSEDCRFLDGERYPEEKSTCLVEHMNQGDMFMGDLAVVIRAAQHAIDIQDKTLASRVMASMEWMEGYRHYEDINLDMEIGRAIGMVMDSIAFIPLKYFPDYDLMSIHKDTYVEQKMGYLDEIRKDLREAFGF